MNSKRSVLFGWILVFGGAFGAPAILGQSVGTLIQRQAEAELQALHQEERRAHLHHDVNGLLSHLGTDLIDVREGKIQVMTSKEVRERFNEYFRTAQFIAWDDVQPPVVRASPDGRLGWMIVRVHIAYNETNASGKTTSNDSILAWMAAYEKREGKWMMIAVTTTTQQP